MNHYDGPAFYRKFLHDGAVNKHKKIRALRKKKLQRQRQKSVTGFSRDVQRRHDFGDFKPTQTDSNKIDLQNNPIARITAEFKPRRHYGRPDQSIIHVNSAPSEFQQINSHYRCLTSELSPSDDEVTLMADSVSSTASQPRRKGSLHFKLAKGSDVNSSQSFDPFQSIKSTTDESSGKSRLTADSPKSGFQSSSEVKPEATSQSALSVDKSAASSSSNSIDVSESGSSSKDDGGPLGHDFSSIMHDEDQDVKKDLTLFNSSSSSSDVEEQAVNNPTETSSQSSGSSEDSASTEVSGDKSESTDPSSESSSSSHDVSFGERPDFVAQNPTNVQPSSDFEESDSDSDEHHEIQPSTVSNYRFPNHDLLVAPKRYADQGLDDWILNKAEILNKTLRAFNVDAQVVDWTNGPTVTQFQVKLQLGVKVSKINHLSDDLKMALAAKDIRIQAPIPGKTTCGIEIPNPKPRPVMLSEVVNSKTFRDSKSDLTVALGVDLTGKPRVTDLRKMPHGLIAGATGSGKSVFINCMLVSLMYKATPQELKLILIDPKAVEFAPYNGIPYLLSPVISEPKQAAASLKWATKEMNQRYEKLAAAGVRNIEQFNQKAEKHDQPQMKMPYIVIVIDELADLMMVAGDEIETYIVRITQKARAAGIHLIVATQRPSVDVITGTMKNNIPTRVAFMVSSQVDSRTIIDQSGAERLLGKGDMLYLGNGSSHPIRLQGCFVSNQEIDRVAGFARHQESAHYAFHPGSLLKHVSRLENQDKLMPQVLAYIAKEKTVSTSKLQRVFSIGYNRAAKIIDSLEQHGYISGQEGSKPRDVYLTENDYKKLNL